MNWNDDLLGGPVLPGVWVGGVVSGLNPDGTRSWRIVHVQNRGDYIQVGLDEPIFPPADWGGHYNHEILNALYPSGIYDKLLFQGPDDWGWEILINPNGGISIQCGIREYDCGGGYGCSCHIAPVELADPDAFAFALKNALVLSARLKSGGGV